MKKVGAGVFRNSSRMQKTRPDSAAVVRCQLRSAMIFPSGTRSPAPHHAAMTTSGSSDRTSSGRICRPGVPRNSPPAASTSSATHALREAMRGFPHSSHQTLGRSGGDRSSFLRRRHIACMTPISASPRSSGANHSRDGCDVGIDISQSSRSQAKKPHSGSENLADRLFLIRNRRNHEIGLRGDDLRSVGRP